jgi:galactokinase
MIQVFRKEFEERFSSSPYLFKSPGRVNLIGEHTDYNNGFVLPAAIDRYAYFAVKPNGLKKYRFFAYDLNEHFSTSTSKINPSEVHWANYLLGVIAQMVDDGKKIPGFDCVFGADIPMGAGMSSSAAIECGIAFSINHIFSLGYSKLQLASIGQRAEHKYAGVNCGIMDQFASLHGKHNNVMKLDCKSLEYDYYGLDMSHLSLILVNTGVKHSLASSEYNKRRDECAKGIEILQQFDSGIESLRDVELDFLTGLRQSFDNTIWNRCTYVVEENQRVLDACNALDQKDFNKFGNLMSQSHYGLRDKYQVSCNELDKLVEIAESLDYVLGGRMMGGGFGGCTINLVSNDRIESFKQEIISNYTTPEGKQPDIISCVISNGTEQVV